MPNPMLSQLTFPVTNASTGEVTNVTFDIKDAAARQLIADLGNAVYWIGVTTTALTDGATTNPITVGEKSVTAKVGGMAQYDGEEFVFNGTAWQSVGKNNFGDLAFKSSASGNFTPQGSVSAPTISVTGGTTATLKGITGVGALPSCTVDGENLTFNAGSLPTAGSDTTVVTGVGTIEASQPTFIGTQGTVTVS